MNVRGILLEVAAASTLGMTATGALTAYHANEAYRIEPRLEEGIVKAVESDMLGTAQEPEMARWEQHDAWRYSDHLDGRRRYEALTRGLFALSFTTAMAYTALPDREWSVTVRRSKLRNPLVRERRGPRGFERIIWPYEGSALVPALRTAQLMPGPNGAVSRHLEFEGETGEPE